MLVKYSVGGVRRCPASPGLSVFLMFCGSVSPLAAQETLTTNAVVDALLVALRVREGRPLEIVLE
jgi:hypothetical protein